VRKAPLNPGINISYENVPTEKKKKILSDSCLSFRLIFTVAFQLPLMIPPTYLHVSDNTIDILQMVSSKLQCCGIFQSTTLDRIMTFFDQRQTIEADCRDLAKIAKGNLHRQVDNYHSPLRS